MKINLIPISHQTLATIEIDADEFLVGRMEEPFVSAPQEITDYMSRRHAKIFREEDHFCIIDLGSQNGTKVNGSAVSEQPLILHQNDEIEIAENLKFKVEIINPQLDATVLIQKQHNELTLEPVDRQSGLDILVITGFPFLISKEAGIFASFQTSYAAELSQISRRHAYISVEQENIKLTDMESTNGTFVNTDRIDSQGKVLQNGDIISFGGDFFSYIVKLNQPEQSSIDEDATQFNPVTEPKQANEKALIDGEKEAAEEKVAPVFDEIHEPRTTFVNDPSPFLDILCEDESVSEPVETASAEGKASEVSSRKTSFFSKKLFFLNQLCAALKDNKPAKNKWRFISLLSVLLLTISGVAFFYLYNRSADVEELINRGDYPKAAEQAMELLAQTPENMTLLNLSTKAILNSIVPQWQNDLKNNKFSQAETLVKETQSKFAANPEIEKVLPLMQWVNRLYQFLSTRNENAKIVIFQNEHQLSSLMDTWNQNKKQNELLLALIRRNVPAFKETYNEILSFIRTLEHDQDIYINAINELKTSILSKLQANQTDELMTEVAQFEKKISCRFRHRGSEV